LREFADPDAGGSRQRILVQTDESGHVITWIPKSSKPRYFDGKRTGTLRIKEGA
jgi:hypothetical protein